MSTTARRPWRDYSLSIVLGLLFLVSWVGQALAQWQEWAAEQLSHGQAPELAGFLWAFASATFENWQSEFLQLFAFVILSALLVHRGSPQSKTADEETQDQLRRIAEEVIELGRKIDALPDRDRPQ